MSGKENKPKQADQKFPSEIIDLPSEGKIYPPDHPLSAGNIELKYMTAKEEDILTSQNLIRSGNVLDVLLNSVILTEGVTADDLIIGDKNAVMIACRILAYGSDYTVVLTDPETGEKFEHTFDLSDLPYKKVPDNIKLNSDNKFEFNLPASKAKLSFKLLSGRDEREIIEELQSLKKLNLSTGRDITTRLKKCIVSVNGESDIAIINNFVDNMLSRDSLALRNEMNRITPDIQMSQEITVSGERREVSIPMDVNFFWPSD